MSEIRRFGDSLTNTGLFNVFGICQLEINEKDKRTNRAENDSAESQARAAHRDQWQFFNRITNNDTSGENRVNEECEAQIPVENTLAMAMHASNLLSFSTRDDG